jgi:hypothetical protein
MLTKLRTLVLASALALVISAAASAQSRTPTLATAQSHMPTYSTAPQYMQTQDALYNFNLYIASFQMNYYVVATYKNGNVVETKHSSQAAAQAYAEWLWFHIAELDNAHVESRYEAGAFVYFDTYDKLADAQHDADVFESIGLATDIVWVNQKSFQFFYSQLLK